ncbi:hypothetical protein HW130_31410 [Streptomyces sp. PKU-EA00015]|uniref:hypothetical protein n=1 Tax=Streptomyces sp. PKU-EA00015 TaxID=2748326 RepID=UPI0015A212E6|nr:hypothetical protein [Streptomyces sp. PKU-EA00015]NWF30702.1 hypothetical protein [Streptomyces sp. PKU-EA00015]
MRTRPRRTAVLVLPLALSLAACSAEAEEPAVAGSPEAAASSPAPEPSEAPESPEDFLDLAEKAMAEESAWTFSVEGDEGLTLQGQKSAATYEGTVRRAVGRAALHSQGVSTSSKGKKKTEELYVVGEAGFLKEGTADFKAVSPADPEMRNKAEDPIAVVDEFRIYAQAAGGEVKVTETDGGTVELRVVSGKQKLSAVQGRAWAKKAKREFDPTAAQLREAGIPVEDGQLTLSGLEEVLVLDAKTYRIKSHRLDFGFLIPYNGQDIAFEQRVAEENQGPYEGKIELPAGVR